MVDQGRAKSQGPMMMQCMIAERQAGSTELGFLRVLELCVSGRFE